MGLRYEVWTLPWDSGGFKRKFFVLPTIEGSGRGTISFLTTQGEGTVDIPVDAITAMGRTMDEIVSDTTSSLIRVIDCLKDGTNTIIDEWVCERPARNHDDKKIVTISGPPLKTKAFDGTVLYPFDYPTSPTKIEDHIWGGKNVLSDPSFENASAQNETYEIDVDGATGGSFVLHIDGNDSSSIAYNASVAAVESAVQGITGITDVSVTGTSDGWIIEFVVPYVLPSDMTWTDSMTGGGGNRTLTKTQLGLTLPSSAWTRSMNADASTDPGQHGTYASDGFRLTTGAEPVRTGTYAARINGLTQFAGIQQVVQVTPGMTYQASIWVYTSDATEEFRLVIRDVFGRELGRLDGGVSASTWTEFAFEITIDPEVDTIIFRFAQTVDHNPSPFYVDDAAFNEGMAPATWGEIMSTFMNDAALDHSGDTRGVILDWIDYSSFDSANDSGSTAWPRNESYTGQFGQMYGQIFDDGVGLGYEWDLVPKATPSGGKTHDLVWYVEGGMDADPSTGINPGPAIAGGSSLTRTPAYTRVIAEGEDGLYVEDVDATSLANFGPMEKYVNESNLTSAATLGARVDQLIAYELANRNAVQFQLIERLDLPRPLVHFRPGDTIPMQQPPGLQKTEKRVQDISYTNTFPTQYVITGSRVLKGEAAAYNLLWRLWRRFEKPKKERRSGALQSLQGSVGVPTILIAASDASEDVKNAAQYVCDGTNDLSQMLLALQALPVIDGPYFAASNLGRIVLSEGNFYWPGSTGTLLNLNFLSGDVGPNIEGQGETSTIIHVDQDFTGTVISVAGATLKEFAIVEDGTAGQAWTGIKLQDTAIVENVRVYEAGTGFSLQGINARVLNCYHSATVGASLVVGLACEFDLQYSQVIGFYTNHEIRVENVSSLNEDVIMSNIIAYRFYGDTVQGLQVDNMILFGEEEIEPYNLELYSMFDCKIDASISRETGDAVGGAYIEGTWRSRFNLEIYNAGYEAFWMVDSHLCDVHVNISGASRHTTNTYDAVVIGGTSGELTLRGRVANASGGNQPRYLINFGMNITDIISELRFIPGDGVTGDVLNNAGTEVAWVPLHTYEDPNDGDIPVWDETLGRYRPSDPSTLSGSDGSAIHDDQANEISAITEKATPVSGDLVLIEDSAASYVKKKVQIGNLPSGGGSSPLTTKGDIHGYDTGDARLPVGSNGQVLTADSAQSLGIKWATPSGGSGGGLWFPAKQLGTPEIAWDGDLSGMTAVDVTGTQTVEEDSGILSVIFQDQATQDVNSRLKSVSFSVGDEWVVPIRMFERTLENFCMAGLLFTDGSPPTSSSNAVCANMYFQSTGSFYIWQAFAGTLTSLTTSSSTVGVASQMMGHTIYVHLEYTASNSFTAKYSLDGKNPISTLNLTPTITPTHLGVFWSAWNASSTDGIRQAVFGPVVKVA